MAGPGTLAGATTRTSARGRQLLDARHLVGAEGEHDVDASEEVGLHLEEAPALAKRLGVLGDLVAALLVGGRPRARCR